MGVRRGTEGRVRMKGPACGWSGTTCGTVPAKVDTGANS